MSIKANVLTFETETLTVFFSIVWVKLTSAQFGVVVKQLALLDDCLPLCPLLENPWAGSNPYLFKPKAVSTKCSLQIGLMCPFLPHLSQYLSLAQQTERETHDLPHPKHIPFRTSLSLLCRWCGCLWGGWLGVYRLGWCVCCCGGWSGV